MNRATREVTGIFSPRAAERDLIRVLEPSAGRTGDAVSSVRTCDTPSGNFHLEFTAGIGISLERRGISPAHLANFVSGNTAAGDVFEDGEIKVDFPANGRNAARHGLIRGCPSFSLKAAHVRDDAELVSFFACRQIGQRDDASGCVIGSGDACRERIDVQLEIGEHGRDRVAPVDCVVVVLIEPGKLDNIPGGQGA